MGIIVQEVTDADIARACEIEVLAYANNAASPILFPGPFPPNAVELRVQQIIDMRKNDPTAQYLKAVDDETGEQIAFAKWHIYKSEDAVASAPTRPVPSGKGTNVEACKAFFGGMIEKKNKIVGIRPHLYLHMLHADPKQQGRGAGGALIKWGTQKADELGLIAYLESSPSGHQLYKKHGFEDVEVFELDLSVFGGDKVHIAPLMIRNPKSSSG